MALYGDASLPPNVRLVGVRGEEIPLATRYVEDQSNWISLNKGAKGLDAPEFDVQTDAYPTLDGEFIRFVRATGREVFLPITIFAPDRVQMIQKKRQIIRAMNPKIGTVKLVTSESLALSTEPELWEDERELELYYSHGLEGDEGKDNGMHWMTFGLVLRATYPFFRATSDILAPFVSAAADPVPFLAAPQSGPTAWVDRVFRLSEDAPFASEITVFNPGDEDTYLTWHFAGPLRGPFTLVRESTTPGVEADGLNISGDFVLTAGQSATINTNPGQQNITSDAGLDFSVFGVNPNFWALPAGLSTITIVVPPFELDSNGNPTAVPRPPINPSSVSVTYRPVFNGL